MNGTRPVLLRLLLLLDLNLDRLDSGSGTTTAKVEFVRRGESERREVVTEGSGEVGVQVGDEGREERLDTAPRVGFGVVRDGLDGLAVLLLDGGSRSRSGIDVRGVVTRLLVLLLRLERLGDGLNLARRRGALEALGELLDAGRGGVVDRATGGLDGSGRSRFEDGRREAELSDGRGVAEPRRETGDGNLNGRGRGDDGRRGRGLLGLDEEEEDEALLLVDLCRGGVVDEGVADVLDKVGERL